MTLPIHHMDIIRYYRDGRHWDVERVNSPSWSDVETAIRRMDNYCFPIVQLSASDKDYDEGMFNVCGGAERWALFHMMGDWQYESRGGGENEVRLWDSDQGYYCREKNILTDVERVLRITKAFYDTGSYHGLDAVN
jgi:hypothetical protein